MGGMEDDGAAGSTCARVYPPFLITRGSLLVDNGPKAAALFQCHAQNRGLLQYHGITARIRLSGPVGFAQNLA